MACRGTDARDSIYLQFMVQHSIITICVFMRVARIPEEQCENKKAKIHNYVNYILGTKTDKIR